MYGSFACSSTMSMSVSIMDLYSTESWSISIALYVLSGNDEIGSFSAIVWSCCCWVLGHGDCLIASSRPATVWQRRPSDRKCLASNVVWSGDVEWLTVNDVGWECLRLMYSSRQLLRSLVLQTAMHCDSQFVVDAFRTSSQCNSSCSRCDKPWSNLRVPVTRRTAAFSTRCSLSVMYLGYLDWLLSSIFCIS